MKEFLKNGATTTARRYMIKAAVLERMKSMLLAEYGSAIKDSLIYQKYDLCRAWYVLKSEIYRSLFRLN